MNRFWQMTLAGSIVLLGLSACDPKIDERGKYDLAEAASSIKAGETTRQEIIELLGTPSAAGQFADKAWYYISQRKESHAFFEPDVVDSEVLRVAFNGDVVSEVKHYNQQDMRNIAYSDNATPTEGQKYGFFEQLIGNIGKFNKTKDSVGE